MVFFTTETALGISQDEFRNVVTSTKFCYSSSQVPFGLESGTVFVILSALCDIGSIYSHHLSLENA